MRLSARFATLAAAVSFAVSAVAPFNIQAGAVDTVTLTPGQTRALFGDTISFQYYNGSDMVNGTMQYATNQATITNSDVQFGYAAAQSALFNNICPQGMQYCIYYATLPDITGTDLRATVELSPTINFNGVKIAKMVGGFSVYDDYTPKITDVPYNRVTYYVNGNSVENHVFYKDTSATVAGNKYDTVFPFLLSNTYRYFALAPVYFATTGDNVGYLDSIRFEHQGFIGTNANNRTVRFIVSCPTISADAGSIGSTEGGGSVGGDLTATNRKLDTIIAILNAIANNNNNQSQDNSYLDSETPADQTAQSQAEGQFEQEYATAASQQQQIDSAVNHAALDSVAVGTAQYGVDPAFNRLWNDAEGNSNPLILGMCLLPITIAVISYILFGKRI